MGKGLIIVFTGEGKGKTTAALGIALRASGHKMYVSIVQFLKRPASNGEAMSSERLAPHIDFISSGSGFVNCCGDEKPLAVHQKAAEGALSLARQRIKSGAWDIVILDEINTALSLGLIGARDVLDLLAGKPSGMHVILTGRGAPPDIIAAADLVTEMRNVKHPYENGVPARKGIDF